MPPLHRLAVLVVVVVLSVLVLVACSGDGSPSSRSTPPPASEPSVALDGLAVKKLTVPRAPFCEAVPDALVSAALDVIRTPQVEAYGNGERAKLTRGVRDVAHEYSCTWDDGRAQARAWVFAPPADRALARDLTSALRGTRGCTEVTDAAAYGAPSVSVTCDVPGGTRVLRAGLLGDAWLTCSLTLPGEVGEEELVRRSADWCAGLLTALTGPPVVAG